MTFVSDETVTGTDKNKRWKAVRVGQMKTLIRSIIWNRR